jgi:Ser/Thr protein kinase RdoA (MazF antagonist)
VSALSWPLDHPAVTDHRLRPYAASAATLWTGSATVTVLKYEPGRRVASRIDGPSTSAVLKLYSTHRAHKTFRRLAAFASTDAAGLVPAVVGLDETEHACLAEFVAGEPLDQLDADRLEAGCRAAGASLRRLHGSGAELARVWLPDDEVRQLRASCGRFTRRRIERVIGSVMITDLTVVPSHRDCYAAQAIVADGAVRWIDLDDAAMAPAGLDVGNFLGNLVAHYVPDHLGKPCRGAMDAFLDGYGAAPADLDEWTRLSLARLAGLLEVRHGDRAAIPHLLDAAEHIGARL